MKLTRSTAYALVALAYLARTEPRQPVLAKKIAQQHNIPLDYLLKILQQLTHADILSSIRGPLGGFLLNRLPREISLLQIIETIDGPLNSTPALPAELADLPECLSADSVIRETNQKITQTLKKTSLADLIKQSAKT